MTKLKRIRFKEFVVLQRGFDLPKKEMIGGPYPVVGSTSIIGYHNEYKVNPPGVVTGRSGSLGFVQYLRDKYWPHNTSLWVKDFKGNFPQYIYYHLLTLDLKRFNSGVGVPTLNRNDLDMLEISIHPLPTQRKIVAVLSAYDDLIENNNRRIRILEEMTQMIYREWFVNFHFPGHEQVKMVESALGMMPEGWEVKTVSYFGKVLTGKTPSKKVPEYFGDSVPFIKIPDINGNMFCIDTEEKLSELGANSQGTKTIPANSLCVSCIGTAGIVAITTTPSQTNQQINSVVLRDETEREYLFFVLQGLKQTINQFGAIGATMANLSKGKFEALPALYPDRGTLSQFNKLVFPIFEQIKSLQFTNANLRRTRDLLLPRLISGEIDVSELDIKTEGIEA